MVWYISRRVVPWFIVSNVTVSIFSTFVLADQFARRGKKSPVVRPRHLPQTGSERNTGCVWGRQDIANRYIVFCVSNGSQTGWILSVYLFT